MTSTARALYNVFIRPLLSTAVHSAASRGSIRLLPHFAPGRPSQPFSTTVPREKIRVASANRPNAGNAGPPSDDQIPARRIQMVNEDGTLGANITRWKALAGLPSTERIVCVSKPPRHLTPRDHGYDELRDSWDFVLRSYAQAQKLRDRKIAMAKARKAQEQDGVEDSGAHNEEDAELDDQLDDDTKEASRSPGVMIVEGRTRYILLPSGEEWVPICKQENKAEAAAKARREAVERKEAKKYAPEGIKIIELNWAMDVGNDLQHRLKKLREFLVGRRRVEIVIAPKKGGRRATPEEAERLYKMVRGAIQEVPKTREYKKMEGTVGEVVRLQVEGDRAPPKREKDDKLAADEDKKSDEEQAAGEPNVGEEKQTPSEVVASEENEAPSDQVKAGEDDAAKLEGQTKVDEPPTVEDEAEDGAKDMGHTRRGSSWRARYRSR